ERDDTFLGSCERAALCENDLMPAMQRLPVLALLGVAVLSCAREEQRPAAPVKQAAVAAPAKRVVITPQMQALAGCYQADWRPANPFPRYAPDGPPKVFVLTTEPVE